MRNLPSYGKWQKQFKQRGVTVIGVHTPETEREKSIASLRKELRKRGITYPVLVDGGGENWRRWRQRYWPTVYLIDKRGRVRYVWVGELEYRGASGTAIMTQKIEELIAEKL